MSNTSRNPQEYEMTHESMVRNLAAQAEAVWPQEKDLFPRYGLAADTRILDLACGTGEISRRIAPMYPEGDVTGIDLHHPHLVTAYEAVGGPGGRIRFLVGDGFHLPFGADTFDLSLCRHTLQAVPDPQDMLAEMLRVTRPGGRLHVLAEDYAMMHFYPTRLDCDRFWHDGPLTFGDVSGTNLRVGRAMVTLLRRLGVEDITVDYLVVDTLRVDPRIIERIWMAWRDGYSGTIARNTSLTKSQIAAYWEDMLRCLRDPQGYGVWLIPAVSAVVPATR